MGNQQSVKSSSESKQSIPNLSIGGAAVPSSIRSSRNKTRVPKDSRILGSNIFTEHSGKSKATTIGQQPVLHQILCFFCVSEMRKILSILLHFFLLVAFTSLVILRVYGSAYYSFSVSFISTHHTQNIILLMIQ